MPLTKADIVALPDATVNDLAAEQVLAWTRAAGLSVGETGGVSTDEAWLEASPLSTVTRADGSTVQVPSYLVHPRAQTPAFISGVWPLAIMRKMAARGLRMIFQAGGAGYTCAFVLPAATGADVLAASVSAATAPDAILRAALLAVQQ
jgi:hypothetical protein